MTNVSHWESSKVKYSDNEIRIGHLTNHMLGKHFKDPGTNLAINLNLYNFFLHHMNTPDKKLALIITRNNKQIFSEKDISEIKKTLKTHSDSPYVKSLLKIQTGGNPSVAEDKTRSGFWNKLIIRMATPITSRMPAMFNYVLWYVQILYHLEQMEVYGPFVSQALDVVTLSIPVVADLAEEVAGKIVGLAPIPYAAVAGDAIGFVIGLFFVLTAVLLNNSRRHFGAAFKVALDGIPIIGDALSLAAMNFETGVERFSSYKDKTVKSVTAVLPKAGQALEEALPNMHVPERKNNLGEPIYDGLKMVKSTSVIEDFKENREEISKLLPPALAEGLGEVQNAKKMSENLSAELNDKLKNPVSQSNTKKIVGGSRRKKQLKHYRKSKKSKV